MAFLYRVAPAIDRIKSGIRSPSCMHFKKKGNQFFENWNSERETKIGKCLIRVWGVHQSPYAKNNNRTYEQKSWKKLKNQKIKERKEKRGRDKAEDRNENDKKKIKEIKERRPAGRKREIQRKIK